MSAAKSGAGFMFVPGYRFVHSGYDIARDWHQQYSSLPGLTRQSIFLKSLFSMDARVKPAHDGRR
jgi:hypothetical protein